MQSIKCIVVMLALVATANCVSVLKDEVVAKNVTVEKPVEAISVAKDVVAAVGDIAVANKSSIVNPHPYNYILNSAPVLCGDDKGASLLLLGVVSIAPCNFAGRAMIRRTWGNANALKNFKIVFMLGKYANSSLDEELQFESNLYNDMVQEDFVDSHENMTLKSIMSLKWISTYCSNVKYVAKVSKHSVLNPVVVLDYLSQLNSTQSITNNTVMCMLMKDRPVNRTLFSKEVLPADVYPTYCNCSGGLYTGDLATKLYAASRNVKPLYYSSVYLSVLARDLNITMVDLSDKYLFVSNLAVKESARPYEEYYFIATKSPNQFNIAWNHILFTIKNLLGVN